MNKKFYLKGKYLFYAFSFRERIFFAREKNMSKCEICGKETKNNYCYCENCYTKISTGELVQCENCKTIHNADIPCPKCKTYSKLPEKGFKQCIICGARTRGHAFCKKCWTEKENKELLKILNEKIAKTNKKQETENIEEHKTKYDFCVVCGKPSNGNPQCVECYSETENHLNKMSNSLTVIENRKNYSHIKHAILNNVSIQEIKKKFCF